MSILYPSPSRFAGKSSRSLADILAAGSEISGNIQSRLRAFWIAGAGAVRRSSAKAAGVLAVPLGQTNNSATDFCPLSFETHTRKNQSE
jgi:hypothetical protein